MKQSLISYLFPLSLCALIGISTFILNAITDVDNIEIKKYHPLEVIATFSDTSVFRYNKEGLMEQKIKAKKIEQLSNNKYILYNANINKYENNNLIFDSKANNVIYNPDNGNLYLNNTNTNNKVKIILYDKKIYNEKK